MPIEDNEESLGDDTSQDGDTSHSAEDGGEASELDEAPASNTDSQPASPSDTDPRPASASDGDPQPTSASDTDPQPPESQPAQSAQPIARPMRRAGAWRIAIITTLTVLACAAIVTVAVWAVENIAPRDYERTVIYYDDLEYREFREDFLPKRLPDFGKERFWEERWSEEGDLGGWHPGGEGPSLGELLEMFRVEAADVLPYLLTLVELLRDLLGVIQPLGMLQDQLAPEPPAPEPTPPEPPAPLTLDQLPPLSLDQLPPLTQEQLDQLFGLLFGSQQGLGALGSLDPSALGLGSLDLASILGLLSTMPAQTEPASPTDESSAQTTTTTLPPTTTTPSPTTTTLPPTTTLPATTTSPSATATPTTSTTTPATTAPST